MAVENTKTAGEKEGEKEIVRPDLAKCECGTKLRPTQSMCDTMCDECWLQYSCAIATDF